MFYWESKSTGISGQASCPAAAPLVNLIVLSAHFLTTQLTPALVPTLLLFSTSLAAVMFQALMAMLPQELPVN